MSAPVGSLGEWAVAQYLCQNGCFVVQQNCRADGQWHDEIDIVACDGVYLRFVEVKTRTRGAVIPALSAVTAAKQRRIQRCARAFLQHNESFRCYQPRFDVACVTAYRGKVETIQYYPNAFSL